MIVKQILYFQVTVSVMEIYSCIYNIYVCDETLGVWTWIWKLLHNFDFYPRLIGRTNCERFEATDQECCIYENAILLLGTPIFSTTIVLSSVLCRQCLLRKPVTCPHLSTRRVGATTPDSCSLRVILPREKGGVFNLWNASIWGVRGRGAVWARVLH